MFEKPKAFNRVGLIQCFLAAFFVLWFLIKPAWGIYFAWPVKPELTAMFMGAGFILRSYFGYHLWRDKYWYPLRWSLYGDFAFLAVLFVTSWWHMDEMNWHLPGVSDSDPLRIFSLIIAHVWVLAYTFEPVTVFLIRPRDPAANAPVTQKYSEGALQPFTRNTLLAVFYLAVGIWALLFFNTTFSNMRWAWELNAFDSRIISAWPAGCAVWAYTMYHMKDWAEVKMGVRALTMFFLALFLVWLVTYTGLLGSIQFDPARQNVLTFGFGTALLSGLMIYSYWRQEQARPIKK